MESLQQTAVIGIVLAKSAHYNNFPKDEKME